MFLFFHDIGVPVAPVIILAFLDIIAAPYLSVVAINRLRQGQITHKILKRSLIAVGIATALGVLIIGSFLWGGPTFDFEGLLYCPAFPFGLGLSFMAMVVGIKSAFVSSAIGIAINLTAFVGLFSLIETRRTRIK